MPSTTKIEWTDKTWNPVTGCTRVSAGCDHCYARRMAKRLKAMGNPRYANGFEVTCHNDALEEPLHWRKPRMVFVGSMGDLFHEDVPTSFITKAFIVMSMCPQHTLQILTKRPERMVEVCIARPWFAKAVCNVTRRRQHLSSFSILPNVWLGTSCENQDAADERIPHLLNCPAAVRFVSLEPLLSPINLRGIDCSAWETTTIVDSLTGQIIEDTELDTPCAADGSLDWVIVGGESGPGARPMELDWARDIRDQCCDAGVAFFMKQLGGFPNARRKLEDIPKDLRIRKYPKPTKED